MRTGASPALKSGVDNGRSGVGDGPSTLGVEYGKGKIVGSSDKAIDGHFGINVERRQSFMPD